MMSVYMKSVGSQTVKPFSVMDRLRNFCSKQLEHDYCHLLFVRSGKSVKDSNG